MPELPEVETIVRELRKKIIGLRITDVWADWPKTVRQAGGLDNLRKETKNKKILSISRRAKYIIINIEGPKTIFIHQKMSGHLLYGKWLEASQKSKVKSKKFKIPEGWEREKWIPARSGPLRDDNRNKYIRVIFFLDNSYQLALSDLRRFGKIILINDDKVKDLSEIQNLGPEPLDISFSKFFARFEKRRGRLKQVLMNPIFIAGIGNIYSDEILWDAGYHPLCRIENLKLVDIKKIFTSTKKILKKAIKYQGDSMDDYRLPSGEKGRYQNVQKVYHKTGLKCGKNDGGVIKRIKVGGRSAHFCSKHQILK